MSRTRRVERIEVAELEAVTAGSYARIADREVWRRATWDTARNRRRVAMARALVALVDERARLSADVERRQARRARLVVEGWAALATGGAR